MVETKDIRRQADQKSGKKSRSKADRSLDEKLKPATKKVTRLKVSGKEDKGQKAEVTVAVAKPVHRGLTVDILGVNGEKDGTLTLPKDIFGVTVNPSLISQAVRVFLVNQRRGTVATKTRGEVSYSTRKIYRQKGTGRARHGGRGAPVFVKGGVAHGPKPKDYELTMPTKMKRAALFSALSEKASLGNITVVSGVENLKMKTKEYAKAFAKWNMDGKKRNALLVLPKNNETLFKGARNLEGVTVMPANLINTYEVLRHAQIVLMKDAVKSLEETFLKTK